MRSCKSGSFLASFLLVCVCGTVLLPKQAGAFVFSYGDYNGVNIQFLNVEEETFSDTDLDPLFAHPALNGNMLDFDPIRFYAESNDAHASVETKSELRMTLMSLSEPISLIRISDGGDYTLAGLGIAQALAKTETDVSWSIIEVNGAPVTPIDDSAIVPILPNGGQYSLPDSQAGNWDGILRVDVDATLADHGISGRATKVELTITNTLSSISSVGGSAITSKKDVGVRVILVPEPAGLWLACLAAWGALRFLARR